MKTCPREDGLRELVCAPGLRQLEVGCVTFISAEKSSYKNDADQLVKGWTSCNRLKPQPRGLGLDAQEKLPKDKVG